MLRRVVAAIALVLALPATAHAETFKAGSVYARLTATDIVLGNSVAERRWARDGLVTTALVDKRGRDTTWSAGRRDFALDLAGRTDLGSERNVPPGRRFTLRSAPDGAVVGEATSAELRAGLPVTIDAPRGARVLLITPSG